VYKKCSLFFFLSSVYLLIIKYYFKRMLIVVMIVILSLGRINRNFRLTCAMLMTPSARVLYPSIVRFLYRFRLCNNIRSLLPSLLRKCGYWSANCNSNSVSSMPPVGIAISLDRRVLLELCILTAMLMDARSEPRGRSITKRVNVKEHSLKKAAINQSQVMLK